MPIIHSGPGGLLYDTRQARPLEYPVIFWQHPVNQTIPDNAWTPLALNTVREQRGERWSSYSAASTTIAAGSDSQVLPQATINVASTDGFTSSGFLVVRISSTDRVIRYTGKTATTFTGCTLGVGTLATSQPIAQAQVTWGVPGSIMAAVAEVAWASNATGLRGIRFRVQDGGFNFPLGTTVIGAVVATNPLLHIQTAEQPAQASTTPFDPLNGSIIEVYQSSGGNLDSVITGLEAPRLVAAAIGGYA